jgi:hypothetical protein
MAELFKDMDNWSLSKDYNGAERFNDGGRPLIAETELADIIIDGIPGKNAVAISVHPYDDTVSYSGEAPTKEAALKIGEDIAGFINASPNDLSMFVDGDFRDFFGRLPVSNVNIMGDVAEQPKAPEYAGRNATIRAYIANVDDMAAMLSNPDRLRSGEYAGAWLDFPTTKEAVQAALKEIGVDGVTHKSYVVCNYKTELETLYERLPIGADIDELNLLAIKVDALTGQEQEDFTTIMLANRHCGSVAEIINAVENISLFDVQPVYSLEQYAEFLADCGSDGHAEAMERLSMFQEPEMRELVEYIGRLEKHFNAESYAREVVAQEDGVFTDWGYVAETDGFKEVYKGVVPPEYRVFAYPERSPQERPSAIDKLAAAKEAVARADAEKPQRDKQPGKTPDAEL